MAHRINDMLSKGSHEELSHLKPEVDRINLFPVAEKVQLEAPLPFIKLRLLRGAVLDNRAVDRSVTK
jgi:hypothetical protein